MDEKTPAKKTEPAKRAVKNRTPTDLSQVLVDPEAERKRILVRSALRAKANRLDNP